jgi:peroxiredoxin
MRKVILFLLLSLLVFSCGKNKTQLPPGENDPAATGIFYPIKQIGEQDKKGDFYDFSWDQDGKIKKLSDYKGRVILLNFWATWCPPCLKEIPQLAQISIDLQGKNFILIGISIDQNLAELDRFVKMFPLPYPILHDDGNLIEKYTWIQGSGSTLVPQSFVIDKDGKVVESIFGARNKDDYIKILNRYL